MQTKNYNNNTVAVEGGCLMFQYKRIKYPQIDARDKGKMGCASLWVYRQTGKKGFE